MLLSLYKVFKNNYLGGMMPLFNVQLVSKNLRSGRETICYEKQHEATVRHEAIEQAQTKSDFGYNIMTTKLLWRAQRIR